MNLNILASFTPLQAADRPAEPLPGMIHLSWEYAHFVGGGSFYYFLFWNGLVDFEKIALETLAAQTLALLMFCLLPSLPVNKICSSFWYLYS